MKNVCISVVLAALTAVSASAQGIGPLEAELVRLDRTLEMAPDYLGSHVLKTGTLRDLLEQHLEVPSEAYDLYEQLYKAEFSYSFDAAMQALEGKADAAVAMKDKARISETNVDRALLFCVAGMYLESMQAAEQVDTTILGHDKLVEWYDFRQRFTYDFREYSPAGEEPAPLPAQVGYYRSRIIAETGADEPIHRLMQLRELIDEGELEQADSLGLAVLSELDPSTHEYAELAYWEGTVCRDLGRDEDMMCWFARSACGDIRSATKDNAALQTLAVELLQSGRDIDRAFRYTQFSLNDALFFNARLRPWQIAQSLPSIESAYNAEREKQAKRTQALVVALLCLAAVLLGTLALLLVLYSRRRRTQKEIESINSQLQAAMSDLSQANAAKEEYIGLFLTMCSSYIDKLKKYMSMSEIDAELKTFYKTFDNAFLQLYPDFVERFNALLKPYARISLKKDELLNTELRIFAVIKLGITQSSHIATLLRYSVNTIYNYRAQIKNAALHDRDDFEDQVRNL